METLIKMEIKLHVYSKVDSHCRRFKTFSRQRYLSCPRCTSDHDESQNPTEETKTSTHRFVFITKRDCPRTLTYSLSIFPGCNCYLMRSQGTQEIIDELEDMPGDINAVSHVTDKVLQPCISRDGGVRGLVSQRHLELDHGSRLAVQVHPRRLRLDTLTPSALDGGLPVEKVAERNESSWSSALVDLASEAVCSIGDSARGGQGTAPNKRDRETCQNQFSITESKLPGPGWRRLQHRIDQEMISPRDTPAGSQHKHCRLLADKPVAVGSTDAGCGVFANTSARIQNITRRREKCRTYNGLLFF